MARTAEIARVRPPRTRLGGGSRALALVAIAAFAVAAPRADAQRNDAPLPPQIYRPTVPTVPTPVTTDSAPPSEAEDAGATPPTAPGGLVRPPNAARLAPLPEQRADSGIEEIIVLGGNWRLPDLGSAWRARQQAAEQGDGPHLTFLPLYDPERPTTYNDNPFILNREMTRVGYIDLFRVRFGRRGARDDE
jgi:hypothetical protein